MGGSQAIQITKDSNIKKYTVGKCALKKGAKGVAGQSFAKETGLVTHGSNWPSQQKREERWGYPAKIYGGPSCLRTAQEADKCSENVIPGKLLAT